MPTAIRSQARLLTSQARLLTSGRNSDFLPGKTHDWGMARWAPYLATIMIDGEVGVANYECHAILGKHYCRINKWLNDPRIPLDKPQAIPRLIEEADKTDLAEAVQWLGTAVTEPEEVLATDGHG